MNLMDFEELVMMLLNIDDYENTAELEDKFYRAYEIDFEEAHELASDLLKLCVAGRSPITKKNYVGFGKDGVFAAKIEIKE